MNTKRISSKLKMEMTMNWPSWQELTHSLARSAAITRSTTKISIYLKLVDSFCCQNRARACMQAHVVRSWVRREECMRQIAIVTFLCIRVSCYEIINSPLHIFSGNLLLKLSKTLDFTSSKVFFPAVFAHVLIFFSLLLFIQLNGKQ